MGRNVLVFSLAVGVGYALYYYYKHYWNVNNDDEKRDDPRDEYEAKSNDTGTELENLVDINSCTDNARCLILPRLLFILIRYPLWIKDKLDNDSVYQFFATLNNITLAGTINANISSNTYDCVKLMKDFNHCKTKHSLESMIDDECQNCEQCFILNRHKLRKNNQYQDDGNLDIKEAVLLKYLDMIHCEIFHRHTFIPSNTNTRDTDRFTTQIILHENHNLLTQDEKHDEKHDEKQDEKQQQNDTYPEYKFGINFTYWSTDDLAFVVSKYKNLKDEYLNNALCPISVKQYEKLLQESLNFQNIYQQNMPKVKRIFPWMQQTQGIRSVFDPTGKMKIDDEMSLQHIMVIKSYCDLDEMQRKYKRVLMMSYKNEPYENMKKRNSEIAIWCKLFSEAVKCFGDELKENHYLYHGLSRKLSFDRMGQIFQVPTSCTRLLQVAQMFAPGMNGIIIKLQRNQSAATYNYYFDVYSKYEFSSFPNERENILYGTNVGFVDILYQNIDNQLMTHSKYIVSLSLYQKLIHGEWFTFDARICNDITENILVKFIKCLVKKQLESKTVNDIEYGIRFDDLQNDEIDPYLQHLFETMTRNCFWKSKQIHLNYQELKKLTPVLCQTFTKFISFLRIEQFVGSIRDNLYLPSLNITKQQVLEFTFKKQWKTSIYEYKVRDNQKIEFYFYCFPTLDLNLFGYFAAKSIPKNVESVTVRYGVWFPQLLYQKWSCHQITAKNLGYGDAIVHFSLLRVLDPITIKIAFQILEIEYK